MARLLQQDKSMQDQIDRLRDIKVPEQQLFIDGDWRPAGSGAT